MRARRGSPDTWGLARKQAAYRATGTSLSAIDLLTVRSLAGSSSARRNACGEESAGYGLATVVKLSPLKQEPDPFDASA